MNTDDTRGATLKALTILEALSQDTGYFGISQISAATGLSPSTVHRVLHELVAANYVKKHERIKKYGIGTEALTLASRLMRSSDLISSARPEMERLNSACLETVHLFGLTGMEAIYLSKVQTKHPIGLLSTVGRKNPVYCTSGGKAIAAFMPEEWLDNYLEQVPLVPLTSTTITTEEGFREEMRLTHNRGYALDNGEHHAHVICVAAPVLDRSGLAVASVSVAAPGERFPLEMAEALAPQVVACAQAISAKLMT